MKNRKHIQILLISLIVAVSGCTEVLEPEESQDDWETPDPEKGLEIETFESTDSTLLAREGGGQRAELRLVLSNYHTESVELQNMDLYNTGLIEVSDGPDCNKNTIERAVEDQVDRAECVWEIYAPAIEELDAAGERTTQPTVSFEYESSFTNQEPVTVQFQETENMDSITNMQESFTNSEIQMIIETVNPIETGRTETVDVTLRDGSAPGRVIGDYQIDYEPDRLIECNNGGEPDIDNEYTFECVISSDDPIQDSFLISTEYKYEQTQTVPITIIPE